MYDHASFPTFSPTDGIRTSVLIRRQFDPGLHLLRTEPALGAASLAAGKDYGRAEIKTLQFMFSSSLAGLGPETFDKHLIVHKGRIKISILESQQEDRHRCSSAGGFGRGSFLKVPL